MRDLAIHHALPFDTIDDSDARLALPSELQPINEKLMAYALGRSSTYGLNATEKALLYQRYIHLSAHWNPITHPSAERDTLFTNRPGDNDLRTEHPNE
ncbi:hypothetical protein NPS29_27815 [Pseudomonas putida]|uniref:hypothetical protein n=1 Tax=Pseudomonas putida TaxID=303 RepID=UPI002364780E|nr:hypothetical protein [Pseudomonas putida]MDD1969148.1 hypothetical protein [Pseudomonas putida]